MNAKEDQKLIADYLAEFFKDEPEKITHWLLTRNPMFGEVSPAALIAIRGPSGLKKVADFVKAAKEQNRCCGCRGGCNECDK